MFALDTNTLIYFFKAVGGVKDRLLATPPAEIALPSVVLYELEVGIVASSQPAKRRNQLDSLVKLISVLPLNASAARKAAGIGGELRKRGGSIGPLDTLIAGTVLAHGATLVTHNIREFQRVKGLHVVDWY